MTDAYFFVFTLFIYFIPSFVGTLADCHYYFKSINNKNKNTNDKKAHNCEKMEKYYLIFKGENGFKRV